jgi:cytosine/adenosine deaminase-related metal-dependent hydrolase
MSKNSILLRGGILLLHDSEDTVSAVESDLLIEGNKIKKIAPNIREVAPDTQILDCAGKIISPGFIDTHRHMWQTQLKGRHGDELLFDYIPTGNMAGSLYTPKDIFWGQLAGALESIDSGTTMVVDFSHTNYSIDDAKQAIAATATSGLRSYYCYSNNSNVESWHPELALKQTPWPEHYTDQLLDLARSQPFGNGRIRLGLTWDTWYLPPEMVVPIFKTARENGIKLISCHASRGPTLSTLLITYLT